MDLLSKGEPLINLNGYDSPHEEEEEGDDLFNEDSFPSHNQRRINPLRHSSTGTNRHSRLSSRVYLREISPVRKEQSMERHSSVIVAAVERTMKNYADGVLRVLEGMSGRLSQLESTTQDLEQSVASLKVSVDDYYKSTDRNLKIMGERIMETHRAVQILRDKQDIFEAQAQLAKLQTSQALVEKESSKPSVDPPDATTESSQQQELTSQVQSQHPLHHCQQLVPLQQQNQQLPPSQQPTTQHSQHILPSQQPNQHITLTPHLPLPQPMPQSQPLLSQSQPPLTQQYQMPSVQLQQQGVPQEASVIRLDQTQYQAIPQQMQVQPLQITMQPPSQTPPPPAEQIHYLPAKVLPHLSQQGPGQSQTSATPQLPELAQFQQQRQNPQMPPSLPPSVQQSSQMQQLPLQGPQPILPPPPPPASLMQQPPNSRPQGSFQYYGQSNDTQNYAPGSPSLTSSGYIQEASRDPANYSVHQLPFSTSAHQPPPLPSGPNYLPQVPQSSHEPKTVNVWNRQTNPTMPRLPTAQPVRAEHGSAEVNGVVEKVAAMGFSREQVQNVIRRLAERNQAIDMNVVLDILMNGGYGR